MKREINDADRSGLLSKPIIQDAEARNLPYLQACIIEGLRMWPPVLGLMQKRVPQGGETIDNKFIPGGTNIGYCAWGVHRNKEVFGEDAHLFRPERWLGVDEERLIEMHRVADLVFGSGRYGCLGKPVALFELGKALAEV